MNKHLSILAIAACLASGAAFAGPVNVNTDESMTIARQLGVTPEIGARIVAEREENGRFKSADELAARVKGLSPQVVARNKANIKVSDS